MTAIVIVVVSVVGWFAAAPGSSSKTPTAITALPSIEELGVKPDPHEEVDAAGGPAVAPGGSGWSSFWGTTSPSSTSPPTPSSQVGGKRVGENEQ
jgi:hypothetical protein